MAVGGDDADDGVLALGERPGLVEQDSVDGAARFERQAVLDQDAVAGGDARVESEVMSGMARPRAWGQEMTSTVTTRMTASSGSPTAVQAMAVMTAAPAGDVEQQCGGTVGEHLGA